MIERDEHDVRLRRHDGNARQREARRQPLRARVVLGEAVDMMVERVQAGRGQNADLAHAAAPALARAARLLDDLGVAHQNGADGAAQPFREAHHDGVGARRPLGQRHTTGDTRIPQARAIEMNAHAALTRRGGRCLHHSERHHDAPSVVEGVLEAQQRPPGDVFIGGIVPRRLYLGRADRAARSFDRVRETT